MDESPAEHSLSVGLKLGFALILLLLATTTFVGVLRLAEVSARLERIVSVNNAKTELAHTMKDALRERAIIMHTVSLLTDPFDQNDEFLNFNDHGVAFSGARNRLETMALSDEEKNILAHMRELTITTQPLVVQAMADAMNGNGATARALIGKQIVPAQKLIALEINRLLELQNTETDRAVQETLSAYAQTRLVMLLLGGSGIGLGLLVAFFVVRHTDRQAQLLRHQAMYDNLTGLPNRTLFADRLQQTILIARREAQPFVLIAMDLNRFKEINDNLGHHAGDQVLRHVAERARNCLRESDTIARMGGDEFTILLPTVTHKEGAEVTARRIIEALKTPLQLGGQTIEISGSLGIAMFPAHADEPLALQRRADAAMYAAKRTHSGYKLYSPELDENADERALLQGDLRRGISAGELVLHYQPKIDFGANRISGVEALVRWQHPKLGLLPPDRFLPLAEQTGAIKELTRSVLRMALQQCAEWHAAGMNLSMAVNISALNVQDPDFPDEVADLVSKSTAPASMLEFEITETAVMAEPARAVECIKRLNALGIQIAIDDFGTGYSSMSYLKELLVAKIKIDKSFVKDMAVNHNDAVIVRSTVELGHNLGLKVVAEGVENRHAWDKLKDLGCDAAQGFYLSRPVAAAAFVEWLRDSPWGSQLGPV